jgi:ABC-type branched-subunit amino acid transport system substrate-binding protein
MTEWDIDQYGHIFWQGKWIGVIERTPDRDGRISTRFLVRSVQSEEIDAVIGITSAIVTNPSHNPD